MAHKYKLLNDSDGKAFKRIHEKFLKDPGLISSVALIIIFVLTCGGVTIKLVPHDGFRELLVLAFCFVAIVSISQLVSAILMLPSQMYSSKLSSNDQGKMLWKCKSKGMILNFILIFITGILWYVGSEHASNWAKVLLPYSPLLIFIQVIHSVISIFVAAPSDDYQRKIGHWAAMQYYLGFLKIALPSGANSSEPNFAARMEEFENMHGSAKFRMKKLFILVPHSCNTTGNLKNFNANDINLASLDSNGEIVTRMIDRAGIEGRKYKSTVYKLTDYGFGDKREYFCCAEVATPLQTLYEMVNNSHTNCNMTASDLEVERDNFVKSLREVFAEDQEVSSLCEVLEFNDRSESGERVKLSEVILEHIRRVEDQKNIPIPLLEMQSQVSS